MLRVWVKYMNEEGQRELDPSFNRTEIGFNLQKPRNIGQQSFSLRMALLFQFVFIEATCLIFSFIFKFNWPPSPDSRFLSLTLIFTEVTNKVESADRVKRLSRG